MECPRCKTTKIRKVGKFPTYSEGKKQRFQCAECAKTFYETNITKKDK